MKKVLIDTNIYVAFKRNIDEITESFRHIDKIFLEITVIAELISGFKLGSKEKFNRKELEEFINSPRVNILNHDFNTAEFYGDIFRNLKNSGTPIPTNDIWISAVTMQHGLQLFTLDKHFAKVPGLLMYNY